jgi:hypothetical protein
MTISMAGEPSYEGPGHTRTFAATTRLGSEAAASARFSREEGSSKTST